MKEDRKILQKKAIPVIGYTLGASAFCMFFRWMQNMIAFDDLGLNTPGFWNVLVIVAIIGAGALFASFLKKLKEIRYYMPDNFFKAYSIDGKLPAFLRWTFAAIMAIGGFLIIGQAEVQKDAGLYIACGILAVLSGISYGLLMSAANDDEFKTGPLSVLSILPVLLFGVWVIKTYKVNDINPETWEYLIELVTACVALLSYFATAGFLFSSGNVWRTLFLNMTGCLLCVMTLADSHLIGEYLVFFGAAAQQIFNVWILVNNLRKKPAKTEEEKKISEDDGFEHLT